MRRTLLAVAGLLSVVLVTGCALGSNSPGQSIAAAKAGPLKGVTLNIASKNFTEQLLLCEVTAQRLAAEGATVTRTCGMSSSNAIRAALLSGDVDMYWEYTGTGWLDLQQSDNITDPQTLYNKLAALDKQKNDVIWLPTSSANDTYAIAVKSEAGKRLGISTISQYAKLVQTNPGAATFCGASEFLGRNDGWPGLEKAYGFNLPQGKIALLGEGPIYNAVAKGNPCTFGEVFATDGRISALGLTVLKDDKKFFPPYYLSLNVRGTVLDKHPAIAAAMAPVSKLLTTAELQKLNADIDVDGKSAEEVASAWLSANKLK